MRPLGFALLLALVAQPGAAQQRLARDAEVRSSPTGNPIAELKGGTSWTTGTTRNGWTLVTIQGWVESSRFAGPRDSFPQSIGGTGTMRIRESPSLDGRILGEFRAGAGFRVLERQRNWARVRRDAWVSANAFAAATASTPARPATPAPTPSGGRPATTQPSASSAAPQSTAPPTTSTAVPAGSLRSEGGTQLRMAPGGSLIAELSEGAVVEPLVRDRGWVKVRVEAWAPESLFVPADSTFRSGLTAVDLRLDPAGTRGKVVRWDVQVVGLQTADPLRRDLQNGEPFLLAIGPRGENAILYIAVPASLLEEARALPSMAEVTLTARVRNGRSAPTGAPILDLLSIIRR